MGERNGRRERRPSFQFYPYDFLASDAVAQMTNEEVGVYIQLLCRAWVGPGLPTDLDRLAMLARVPSTVFREMWRGTLGSCFEERDGRLVNPRMEREREVSQERTQKRAAAGSKGGLAKALLHQPRSIATPLPEQRAGKGDGMGWDGMGVSSGVGVQGENPPDEPRLAKGSGLARLEKALAGRLDLLPPVVTALRLWARHRDDEGRPLTATSITELVQMATRDPAHLIARLRESVASGTIALVQVRGRGTNGAPTRQEKAHETLTALEEFLRTQFPDAPPGAPALPGGPG